MNGVAAVVQILMADAALTAVVPESRIVGGVLEQGTALPAITVTAVSGVPLEVITKGANRFVTDRVQATVHSSDQAERHAIVKLIANAGDHARPQVTGIDNVVCIAAGTGPDLVLAEAAIYQKSQDFKVSYTEPT